MTEAQSAALAQAAALVEEAAALGSDFSVRATAAERSARVAKLHASALELLTGVGEGGSAAERGRVLYLRGCSLGADADAEDCLTRAVKLCPDSDDAWNALGLVFQRRGQLLDARSAFAAANARCSNAVSLRHLSGVTRALTQACKSAADRLTLAAESVAHAKEALAFDVADGRSWFNLAMALLTHAFVACGGASEALAPVLKALAQAERCGEAARNPDLLYNRGTVLRYLEDLQGAADSFAAAGILDDTLPWRRQVETLQEDAGRVHDLVAARGRQKPKRVAAAAAAAAATPAPPGWTPAALSTLAVGVNADKSLACRLLAIASAQGAVPVVHVAVDAAGDCFALSLFGLREGALRDGASIVVVAPNLALARLQADDRGLSYPLVRIHGAGGVLCGGAHPVGHTEPPQLSARRH